MKDKSHHRKFIQKKVVQSVRKADFEKATAENSLGNEVKTRGENLSLRPLKF